MKAAYMMMDESANHPFVSLHDLGELKAGTLEVGVASRKEDILAAEELRYQVFFEEMGAPLTPKVMATKRDKDEFDDVCDHLLVVDHLPTGGYKVVGTYRLIRREAMKKIGRFYSDGEYDISLVKQHPGEILEVGRSCVDVAYRNRAVMQLLWRGIGAYVTKFNIDILFGCASFHGTDPAEHAMALSYLYHYHLAPSEVLTKALPARYVEMNIMPKEQVDVKAAFVSLPTLIKGYLRLNGFVGAGAVVDKEYNTTDVSIVVKTDLINKKYAHRYGAERPTKDLAADA
ncbi:MAG: GNAT family N-acetyltransferase [Rickettsiales bacterium]|jgi:putative hemolysin|nr:GNAT family N-acetyltransferase [Rickettsiales bacterium]